MNGEYTCNVNDRYINTGTFLKGTCLNRTEEDMLEVYLCHLWCYIRRMEEKVHWRIRAEEHRRETHEAAVLEAKESPEGGFRRGRSVQAAEMARQSLRDLPT